MDFEIIDDLVTEDPYAALSANQGCVLKGHIDVLDERVTTLEAGSGADITITLATASDIVALFN